ncbi:MAG: hypothetical protein LQ339_000684 [Xanthoria mediterranea]|nr:MAG: hypothetical protein LQ339_000684 [Xanthoria mediterranea]
MTARSTSVVVDGTPSAIPTTRATSVDGEEDPLESNATARHHLEHLALPTIRVHHHWPSAASLNSSLDRMDEGVDNVHPEQPIRQQYRDGNVNALATQVDGTDDHSSQTPSQNVNSSGPLMSSSDRGRDPQEPFTHDQDLRNGIAGHPTAVPEMMLPQSQPNQGETSIPYPQQILSIPQESSPQSSPPPSSNTRTSPPSHHGHDHRHRRRRRILRWVRRRVDHPLPWNLSLRQRTQNVRRRILDVERLLP